MSGKAKTLWTLYGILVAISALIVGIYLAFQIFVKPPEQAPAPPANTPVTNIDPSPSGSDPWEEIPPEEFVPIFLPFLMASNVHPNAKGSLIGLMSAHTRKHLVRSVYEGIAFCHRYHLEKLLKTRSALPESIRLAGGVTRSAVWTQMFADVMQLPIEPVEVQEAGALGCAIAAAVAVGTHPTLDAAAAAMCKISPRVLPDPSKKQIYDRKYALYRSVIDCLDPLWDEMQALVKD